MVIDPSLQRGVGHDGPSGGSGDAVMNGSGNGRVDDEAGIGMERVKDVVEALRKAHPYEVAAVGVVEILDV